VWGTQFDSNETIVVKIDPVSFVARAGGTSSLGRALYVNPDAKYVWEVGPLTRIRTGNNPAEDSFGYDILLGFDAVFVENNYWFDPQPELRTAAVPANKGDFVSVALHELGHGFGMVGFRNFNSGEIAGNVATQFDDLSYFGASGEPIASNGDRNPMFFSGDNAARAFGRDLPLTHKPPGHFLHGQSYYHLSACNSGGSDGLGGTVMNGCALPNGQRLSITPFDIAAYADLGYPLATSPDDYNSDGNVNAADYVVWRKQFGTGHSPAYYNIWRSNFAATSVDSPLVLSVPELSTSALFVAGAYFALKLECGRRLRRR
jgi:hypothetical protein